MNKIHTAKTNYPKLLENWRTFVQLLANALDVNEFSDRKTHFEVFGRLCAFEFTMVRKVSGVFVGQVRAYTLSENDGVFEERTDLYSIWFDQHANAAFDAEKQGYNLVLTEDDTVKEFVYQVLNNLLESDELKPHGVGK